MRQSFTTTFILFAFISHSHALKNEDKTVFVNDDGSNIILTNNRDGRIVHIFVTKSSDLSDVITLQVMGVNIKTRSIHFKDEKVESEDKYQSEILKDTFRHFRGSVDSASYQKLKGIIGKYVQKEEINHNISSALKFLDAQGYELQSLLGNDNDMSCYPSHIIRQERDTVRQSLPHGKCMVSQNTLTVYESNSEGNNRELFAPNQLNRRNGLPIKLMDHSSSPVSRKFKTAPYTTVYNPRTYMERPDQDYISRWSLYDNYEDYLYLKNEPSYSWYTSDMYPRHRFDTYYPGLVTSLEPDSQWTEILPNQNDYYLL